MARAKKTVDKAPVVEADGDFKYFLVKTKGYKKQFTNEDTARRTYAKLEKQKMEIGEPFKIELFGRPKISEDWQEMDFVQISDFDE